MTGEFLGIASARLTEGEGAPDMVVGMKTGEAVKMYENSGGLPTGGTASQVLAKASGTDYDAEWVDVTGGGGGGGALTAAITTQFTTEDDGGSPADVTGMSVSLEASSVYAVQLYYTGDPQGGDLGLFFNLVSGWSGNGYITQSLTEYADILDVNEPMNIENSIEMFTGYISTTGAGTLQLRYILGLGGIGASFDVGTYMVATKVS